MLAIRLPVEIEKRLAFLAKRTGRTKTYYAKEAILQYMDDLEDMYLAAERLEKSRKHWIQEELEQGLDLYDA
ncbi:MAG: anti-toxin [Gammaproteobacteria bacterium RBG_16_51_14]|nr:MAG: anti-toxin [Gammaproteobacteria bacterium RBG_16_51_14]